MSLFQRSSPTSISLTAAALSTAQVLFSTSSRASLQALSSLSLFHRAEKRKQSQLGGGSCARVVALSNACSLVPSVSNLRQYRAYPPCSCVSLVSCLQVAASVSGLVEVANCLFPSPLFLLASDQLFDAHFHIPSTVCVVCRCQPAAATAAVVVVVANFDNQLIYSFHSTLVQ